MERAPNPLLVALERLDGRTIDGRWKLERFLASGGMSAVYVGEHRLLKTRAAVKILRPELFADPVAWDRFEREVTAANTINHAGIVEVLDAGHDSALDVHYVAMELLAGEELRSRMQRGPIPRETALALVDEVLDALGAAHAAGFVHRDLKPENLFLMRGADGIERVKILDFGIARQIETTPPEPSKARTETAQTIGTPAYMPPEQMKSARNATSRADVWAIGAVLYELLSNRLPFDGDSVFEIITSVQMTEPAPLPSDVPAAVAQVVMQCLDKTPANRPADAFELRAALRAARAHAPQLDERDRAALAALEATATPVSAVPRSAVPQTVQMDQAPSVDPRAGAQTQPWTSGGTPTTEESRLDASASTPMSTIALSGIGLATLAAIGLASAYALDWSKDAAPPPPPPLATSTSTTTTAPPTTTPAPAATPAPTATLTAPELAAKIRSCQIALNSGDFTNAVARANEALASSPGNAEATACLEAATRWDAEDRIFVTGQAALRRHDYAGAVEAFRQLPDDSSYRHRPEVAEASVARTQELLTQDPAGE